jgi:8-oxo-dGTP pyrophosphatase MutT (NUDIX family)
MRGTPGGERVRMAPVKQQTSSGGVLYRAGNGQYDVVLIRRSAPDRKVVWCLPKGWVEPGESLEQTALREVREETGLTGKILESLGSIQYRFYSKEDRSHVRKTVHFYLMSFLDGDTRDHDHEVEEARWFDLNEALERLTYPTERRILETARELITHRA